MGTPASGAISLNDIKTEFGGTAPYSLNEYYKADVGVPASGTIKLGDFYDKGAHGSRNQCGADIKTYMNLHTINAQYGGYNTGGFPSADTVGSYNLSHICRRFDTRSSVVINRAINGGVVSAKVGNCTKNTILWWFAGDNDGAALPMSAFTLNGSAVNPTLVSSSTNNRAQYLYRYITPDPLRFRDITSIGFTARNIGDNWKDCTSLFILPNTWTVSNVNTQFTSAAYNVTLEPYEIFAMAWQSGSDPNGGVQSPNELAYLQRLDGTGSLYAEHAVVMKWYGAPGISLWINGSSQATYVVPNSATTWGSVARHGVKITYTGNGYLNSTLT